MNLLAPDPGVSRFPPAHLTAAVEAAHTFLSSDRGPWWSLDRISRYTGLEEAEAREAADWLADQRIVNRAGEHTYGGPAFRMDTFRPLPWAKEK